MSDIFKEMQIPFNSTPSVQAAKTTAPVQVMEQKPIMVKDAIAAAKVNKQEGDTVEIAAPKKKKEGPIKRLKRGIANVKKFFATVGEYAKGLTKGVLFGGVAGCSLYGVGALANKVKTAVASKKNVDPKLIPHKPIAIAAAALIFIGNMWKASLNATDVRSDIHDRYIGTEKK